MKKFLYLIVFAGLLLPTAVWSLEVAFFDNPTYTDTTEESANLVTALEGLGHNVTIFSGITANDWLTATSAANLLVIPELDVGPLAGDLDQAALDAILGYVSGGGGFIGISSNRVDAVYRDVTLWNAIFGFSLVHSDLISPYTLQSINPPFADGPAELTYSSAVEGLLTSSLPAGAEAIYTDVAGETVVSVVPVGSGMFAQLGFDWFTDDPTPPEWNDVLDRTISAVSGDIAPVAPVPALGGFGLAAMIALFGLFGTILTRRFV
jgi:hypothetical protein